VVTRIRESAPILATILAVVALVSAFATATVIFIDGRATTSLATELGLRAGSQLALRASFDLASDANEQDAQVRAAIERTFANTGVHFAVIRSLESDAIYGTSSDDGFGTSGAASVFSFSDFEDHAEFETGTVPRAAREIAVQADTAALLGTAVGDELRIDGLPFTISGTWRALDPLDPRWYGDERVATGGGDPLGAFVVDEAAWTRLERVPVAKWTIAPSSIHEITPANLPAVTSAWAAAEEQWRGTVPEYETIVVEQRLSRTLGEFANRILGLRAIEPVVFILMAGGALVAVWQIVQLLVSSRVRESTLFWSRGQSTGALAGRLTIEVGISALVGAVVGCGVGAWATVALGLGASPTDLRSTAYLVPALVVAATTGIAAVSAARSARTISTPSRGGRTSVPASRVAVPGAAVLVTIGAAVAVWQLRLYGSPLVVNAAGYSIVDPLAVLAPAAALVALVLIAVSLFPLIVGVYSRRAGSPGVRSYLAGRTLARYARRFLAPLVVVALTVGTATIAASFSATWSSSFTRAAQLYAGSDMRVSSPYASISPAQLDVIAATEGVSAVATVDEHILSVGTVRGSTLAASPAAVRDLVTTAGGSFNPEDAASSIQMQSVGPLVAAGTLGLTLRVEAHGFVAPPTLKAWIADPLGRLYSVPFGEPTPEPDGVLAYSADPGGVDGTIASFDVTMPAQSVEDKPSFRLLELSGTSSSGTRTLDLGQFWVLDTLNSQINPPAPRADGSGFSLDSDLRFLRMTASLDSTPADSVSPRLLVSSALASALNLAVGDTIVFTIRKGAERLTGVVEGIAQAIPGARSDEAVLMDLAVNNHFRLRSERTPTAATDLWVATDEPERVRENIRASLPADTRIDIETDPVGRQLLGAASTALWAAALCCLLIAIVAVASASRSRLRWGVNDIASLRAIGLTARDQSSIVLREMGIVLVVAIATGLIAGVVVSLLTVSQLVRAAVDRAKSPEDSVLAFDWLGLIALLALLVAGLAVVLANLSRQARAIHSTSIPGKGRE